ncbi:MAG: hypothetical protein KC457_16335, partial [Myxococcales bacterium]|nr:hypothetical protein [Myxococcales bacterium]
MPSFQAIAIVGRGCVLPGALDVPALWQLIADGRCIIEDAANEDWAIGSWVASAQLQEAVQTRAAALVRGFVEREPSLAGLDPLVHWLVAAGRQALAEMGAGARDRAGLIVGNLGYPTTSLSDYAASVWAGAPQGDPRNRFMSGLPAQLTATTLGLEAGGFALDAACASSLYAIELACRRLAAGEVDLMLAGGVNHADDLFLHLGFRALKASSPTGQSRPFHRDADGLVPAHGAALIALRRLDDALARGERVLAVIRGVGLSNDGRAGNMMAPNEDGQARAMRAAYAMSGLRPEQVSYVECHATGTPVGDQTELRSMKSVFTGGRSRPLVIGSLKANLGHLITASGAASVLKVIAAMDAETLPATPSFSQADELQAELHDGRFRVLGRPEPWTSEGPRLAAVSNFGFGGNNAHLLLEQWQGQSLTTATTPRQRRPIAVTALRVSLSRGAANEADTGERWAEPFFPGVAPTIIHRDLPPIELAMGEVRTPPVDLELTLPQQLSLLRLALDLSPTITTLPGERTGIFAGMQVDAEIARTALRYRHDFAGAPLPKGAGDIEAALVLGCMPNVVANRISAHFDLRGPCFSVSAEEASGTVALELAADKLSAGELDAAIVTAVDLSREPTQAAAAAALLQDSDPSDAAVLLVLERLEDAEARGVEILAVIGDDSAREPDLKLPARAFAPVLGHSHAAAGLLAVATTIEAGRRGVLPPHPALPTAPWLPSHGRRDARIHVRALGGLKTRTRVTAPRSRSERFAGLSRPKLEVYAAEDMAGLRRSLTNGQQGGRGPMRLAIFARNRDELSTRRAAAIA